MFTLSTFKDAILKLDLLAENFGGNTMTKKIWFSLIILLLVLLASCGTEDDNENVEEDTEEEELAALEVDFEVPETAEPGETVELKATVTYGEELVEDADEVMFETWVVGNEENSKKIEGIHQGDGVYTAETTFEEDGIYEMYAHTTARDMHTMPLESIIVGEVSDEELEAYENDEEDSDEHQEEHNDEEK